VIVVTNQRGVALGRMSERDVEDVHVELAASLAADAGAHIDAFFYCPHEIGDCDCRKPGPGMFRQAQQRFPWIDIEASVMIGDGDVDVEGGRRLGMRTLQIGVDVPDLANAVASALETPA
jgi:D-glycero-D-manno-heptose 1,7-bisphosphate phosphatase